MKNMKNMIICISLLILAFAISGCSKEIAGQATGTLNISQSENLTLNRSNETAVIRVGGLIDKEDFVEINLSIGENIKGVRPSLSSSDLDVLSQSNFTNEKGESDTIQELILAEAKFVEKEGEYFIVFEKNSKIYSYGFTFDDPISSDIINSEAEDFAGTYLTILGEKYFIYWPVVPSQFSVTSVDMNYILDEGASREFGIGETSYNIEAADLDFSNGYGYFIVNEKIIDRPLIVDSTSQSIYQLDDDIGLMINDVIENNSSVSANISLVSLDVDIDNSVSLWLADSVIMGTLKLGEKRVYTIDNNDHDVTFESISTAVKGTDVAAFIKVDGQFSHGLSEGDVYKKYSIGDDFHVGVGDISVSGLDESIDIFTGSKELLLKKSQGQKGYISYELGDDIDAFFTIYYKISDNDISISGFEVSAIATENISLALGERLSEKIDDPDVLFLHRIDYEFTDLLGLKPDADNDSFRVDEDCDDNNPLSYPNASEICDGKDNDCDKIKDEGCDSDKDNYIDTSMNCTKNALCVDDNGTRLSKCNGCSKLDCDDSDPKINPAGKEICDSKDNDCDNKTDEGCDSDLDSYIDNKMDCEETHLCMNDYGNVSVKVCYGCTKIDCDDENDTIYFNATEICDGKDNDCDKKTDEGFDINCSKDKNCGKSYCINETFFNITCKKAGTCLSYCVNISSNITDYDNDSFNAQCGNDCDDRNSSINPNATEICNGIDDDCNGTVDDGFNITCKKNSDCGTVGCIDGTYYDFTCNNSNTCLSSCLNKTTVTDFDGDGYDKECDDDCDDSDPTVHPGVSEICDGIDNDCDNKVDEDNVCRPSTVSTPPSQTSTKASDQKSEESVLIKNLGHGNYVGQVKNYGGAEYEWGGDDWAKKETTPPEEQQAFYFEEDNGTSILPMLIIIFVVLIVLGTGTLAFLTYQGVGPLVGSNIAEELGLRSSTVKVAEDYINSCKEKGFNDDQIEQAMIDNQWSRPMIDHLLGKK